jgi:hypothetical protein
MYLRQCRICGDVFSSVTSLAMYCPSCRKRQADPRTHKETHKYTNANSLRERCHRVIMTQSDGAFNNAKQK